MSGRRARVSFALRAFRRCALLASAAHLAIAFALTACSEEPVVTLGGIVDADVPSDEDNTIDEAERERLFRELAERECREDEPVCGANGITYRNYCQAVANGTQLVHPGPC